VLRYNVREQHLVNRCLAPLQGRGTPARAEPMCRRIPTGVRPEKSRQGRHFWTPSTKVCCDLQAFLTTRFAPSRGSVKVIQHLKKIAPQFAQLAVMDEGALWNPQDVDVPAHLAACFRAIDERLSSKIPSTWRMDASPTLVSCP
jgi:hypothetical protein